MTGMAPVCLDCVHFHGDDTSGLTCEAFPTGIPTVIINGNPHTRAIHGDHGIHFAPRDPNDQPIATFDTPSQA